MAVQQDKKSRSKRNMRRSHDSLSSKLVMVDQDTGEMHLRHHMTRDGFYRGNEIVARHEADQDSDES